MKVKAIKLKTVLISEQNVLWLVHSYWIKKDENQNIECWGYELENQCESVKYISFPSDFVHDHMEIVGEL